MKRSSLLGPGEDDERGMKADTGRRGLPRPEEVGHGDTGPPPPVLLSRRASGFRDSCVVDASAKKMGLQKWRHAQE
jgi:hypothetical protein